MQWEASTTKKMGGSWNRTRDLTAIFFSFPETVHCGPSKKIHPSQGIRRLRLHRTVGCRNLSERIGQDVDGLETNGLGLKKPQSRSVSKKNSVSKLC